MKIINTKKDLQKLRHEQALPEIYLDYLGEYFDRLLDTLRRLDPSVGFSIKRYGSMVVLEREDDCTDLSEIGMCKKQRGLLGTPIEFVNRVAISGNGNSLNLYHIFILCDNEFGYSIFSIENQFDKGVECFLADLAE